MIFPTLSMAEWEEKHLLYRAIEGFCELCHEGLSRAQSESPIDGSHGCVIFTSQLCLSSTSCVGCRASTLRESSGPYSYMGTFPSLSLLCSRNKSATRKFSHKVAYWRDQGNRLGVRETGQGRGQRLRAVVQWGGCWHELFCNDSSRKMLWWLPTRYRAGSTPSLSQRTAAILSQLVTGM